MSDFICPEGAMLIPLRGKDRIGLQVIVDIEDNERLKLSDFKWACYSGTAARMTTKPRKLIYMHRLICQTDVFVDHINGNRLDNRARNLRPATHAENMRNRKIAKNNKTGFKGIYIDSRRSKLRYRAQITSHGRTYRLGVYATPEEAHAAYVKASRRLHGEFSRVE